MERRAWTRDQLVKTLTLYCQLSFGKMHSRNPAVIALANAIERTPSAVALKLVNFASLDPDLRQRGVGGMGNTSTSDKAIWSEFFGRWDVLAAHVVVDASDLTVIPQVDEVLSRFVPSGPTEAMRETAERRGQSFFRSAVLAAHDGKCCITGIQCAPLLRASHIVPWSEDPALRLDPRNGLCLNALHDAAFDRGLITVSDRFELQISKRVKSEVPKTVFAEMFEKPAGSAITVPERFAPLQEMLEFHRRNVFVA